MEKGAIMNQLEKLGLIMIKCIEDSVDEGGYIDTEHGCIDIHPNLTLEQWADVQAVIDDLTED
jgi:hypothetical protein